MNIIHRVGAFLVRINFFIYLLIGIVLIPSSSAFFGSWGKDLNLWLIHNRWFFLSGAVTLIASWPACVFFYGDKYATYRQESESRPPWPDPDRYFYQTQISDISAARKAAGYAYVLCKIWTFLMLGEIVFLTLGKTIAQNYLGA